MDDTTRISILKEDAVRLKKLKAHPSQPVREIVHSILDEMEFDELLTIEIKKRWEMFIELGNIKGPRRELLLKERV